MERVSIRPRYNFTLPVKKEEAIGKLRHAIENESSRCQGKFVKPLVVISVREEERHFWSPELSLDLEATGDSTEVRCILGPRSSLWTMFAAFYGLSVLIGIAGLVLGIAQLSLGMSAYGFWLIPVSLAMLAAAYGIALTGQKIAYDQMLLLRSFVRETLKKEYST